MSFWSGPELIVPRAFCAATVLDTRRVIVFGGSGEAVATSVALDSTEILDSHTLRFEHGPKLIMPRAGCAVVRLDTHRIIVVGGSHGNLCHCLSSTPPFKPCLQSMPCSSQIRNERLPVQAYRPHWKFKTSELDMSRDGHPLPTSLKGISVPGNSTTLVSYRLTQVMTPARYWTPEP
eukprot:4559557-Amphidinium_carterae.1